MKSKEFTHNDIEECKLTKKKIDTSKEKYAIILDCDGDKIFSIGFYRMEEFKEFMKGNVENVTQETLNLAGNMLGGMLNKFRLGKEVVEIR